ncbi:hypothetical protein F4821DRAFT_254840 [Hypoxylon rubiginosum]|uniref:Uncharacterized protein n=1 Tax=Hypoxylon rubiginosum TaxID=110542 RepID=A0ACC0DG69_9PEZI|nr:hypothetical protein F4821DRAFT_254840 [Hypoxylon rubiginosum]
MIVFEELLKPKVEGYSNAIHTSSLTIDQVLRLLGQKEDGRVGTEHMERDGVLHIQRLVPDKAINDFRQADSERLESVAKSFYKYEQSAWSCSKA